MIWLFISEYGKFYMNDSNVTKLSSLEKLFVLTLAGIGTFLYLAVFFSLLFLGFSS